MRHKRYSPDALVQAVIEGLEHSDERRQQQAVLTLLQHGPLLVTEETARQPQHEHVGIVRAELLAFLRGIVRDGHSRAISVYRPVTFEAASDASGRIRCEARGEGRDLVLLQLITALQLVGLRQIRACPSPTLAVGAPRGTICGRLFVKTYRRLFCSPQCQKRAYMRQRRANERLKRERARQRRSKGA